MNATDDLGRNGGRPFLFNSDATWIYRNFGRRCTAERLRDVVRKLASTNVSILAQCLYQRDMVFYRSDRFERFGGEVHDFDDSFTYLRVHHFRQAIEEVDPPEVMAKEAHRNGMKFLASLRMNDRHTNAPGECSRFLLENQERIGLDISPEIRAGSSPSTFIMDYGKEEVQERVLDVIREILERYDVDGVELDWMRWVLMYSCDVPAEDRIRLTTEFTRRVRRLLDEAGRRVGKRLLLSARIPQVVADALRCGFDAATWVREGLVDLLCPSDFHMMDFKGEVAEYAAMTAGSGTLLVPSLDRCLGQRNAGRADATRTRACMHSYYRQGADGLSLYNWFWGEPESSEELPFDALTLTEGALPEALARGDRRYYFGPIREKAPIDPADIGCAVPSDRSEPKWYWDSSRTDDYGVIRRTRLDKPAVFTIRIKEDLPATHCLLQFKLEYFTEADEITLALNGCALNEGDYTVAFGAPMQRRMDWPLHNYDVVRIENAQQWLRDGDNEIRVTLTRANDELPRVPIRLIEPEVCVQGVPGSPT